VDSGAPLAAAAAADDDDDEEERDEEEEALTGDAVGLYRFGVKPASITFFMSLMPR
jgi:hypothetical protein